ncbi:hypothetical protein ACF0H5_009586 [Mactra antiquata]
MASTVDCKVVLLGGPSVGKTCLLERYIHGRFETSSQATIAGSFASKRESLANNAVILGCWDTAGSERYASISRMYYRNARAAVVCFDLTDRSSYETARNWVSELRSAEEECKLYFCGTKLDVVQKKPELREMDKETALELALDLQSDYFETSSKTGENVDALFKKIATDFARWQDETAVKGIQNKESIRLHQSSWKKDARVRKEESSCCLK